MRVHTALCLCVPTMTGTCPCYLKIPCKRAVGWRLTGPPVVSLCPCGRVVFHGKMSEYLNVGRLSALCPGLLAPVCLAVSLPQAVSHLGGSRAVTLHNSLMILLHLRPLLTLTSLPTCPPQKWARCGLQPAPAESSFAMGCQRLPVGRNRPLCSCSSATGGSSLPPPLSGPCCQAPSRQHQLGGGGGRSGVLFRSLVTVAGGHRGSHLISSVAEITEPGGPGTRWPCRSTGIRMAAVVVNYSDSSNNMVQPPPSPCPPEHAQRPGGLVVSSRGPSGWIS